MSEPRPRHEMRIRRTLLGKTALQLGIETGISEMRLYSIERGRARVRRDELLAIARALDSTPEAIFPELAEGGR